MAARATSRAALAPSAADRLLSFGNQIGTRDLPIKRGQNCAVCFRKFQEMTVGDLLWSAHPMRQSRNVVIVCDKYEPNRP